MEPAEDETVRDVSPMDGDPGSLTVHGGSAVAYGRMDTRPELKMVPRRDWRGRQTRPPREDKYCNLATTAFTNELLPQLLSVPPLALSRSPPSTIYCC